MEDAKKVVVDPDRDSNPAPTVFMMGGNKVAIVRRKVERRRIAGNGRRLGAERTNG